MFNIIALSLLFLCNECLCDICEVCGCSTSSKFKRKRMIRSIAAEEIVEGIGLKNNKYTILLLLYHYY